MFKPENFPRMLPVALSCSILLSSCGGGGGAPAPEEPIALSYPALAAQAGMDSEGINRYLSAARRGTDITPESIKSLSVGSSINTAASTYNLRPIFDLGRLKEDGRLNVDTTRSQQKTQLRMTSNKAASTDADQFTFDVSASGSIGGEWGGAKAAAAYHHASARRETKSDGSVSVQMLSANTNNIVSILGTGFTGSENFTPYLLGTKLTDEQLRSYVATAESAPMASCAGKPYITGVTVSRYKLTDADPYANIQILSRMESVFSDLKLQHELCADTAIQSALVSQMSGLRRKIESAIADFYAVNGDAFVSQTTSMNQAVGNGQLRFESSDGNTESQNGASLSAQYQNLTIGVGGSTTLQFYKQNGWATALTNVQVSAEAKPAGVADTTAWVSSIQSMLKDQGNSLVPPMGNLPKDPGVKLPEPVGPRHDEDEPPDVAFTSYDQWKEYLADKKKAVDDKKERERAKKRVEEQKLNVNSDEDEIIILRSPQGGDAYQQVTAELAQLKARAGQQQPPSSMPQAGAGDGNLVRFDKMFVNGFETMPYDAVIPQLRPDLDIPGMSQAIGSFPNMMEIMLVSEKLGRLDAYLTFLSGISASNVTPQMSDRYHQFFQKASSSAYDLVSLALSQGNDVTPAVLTGYKKAMFGSGSSKTQSELYKNLQDIDYYNYVMDTLLDPVKGKAWSVAPGGYLPMRWNPNGSGGMQLVTWNALAPVKQGKANKEAVVAIDFTNPNADPLELYRKGMQTLQTPWYPVYVFNQKQDPSLVFMQYFGGYQAIYGPRWVTRPYDGDNPVSPRLVPLWSDYQAMAKSEMHQVMTAPSNSFLGSHSALSFMDWRFSLHFPNSSGDPARLLKYNALLLNLPGDYQPSDGATMYTDKHSATVRDFAKAEYDRAQSIRTDATYNAFRLPTEEHWMRNTATGNLEDTAGRWSGTVTSLVLLPINSNTTGESLKTSFSYAPERSTESIIDNNSLDLMNKRALLK